MSDKSIIDFNQQISYNFMMKKKNMLRATLSPIAARTMKLKNLKLSNNIRCNNVFSYLLIMTACSSIFIFTTA